MQSVTMSNKVIDSTVSNPCSLLLKARTPAKLHHRVFLSGGQQSLCHKYPTSFSKPLISSRLLVKSHAYDAGKTPSNPIPNDPKPISNDPKPTHSEPVVGRTPTEPIKPVTGDSKPLPSITSEPVAEKPASEPITKTSEPKPAPLNRLKIGIYFVTWWGLNVIFNIYNKKVLNAFPFPWLTSTLSLAAGSALMFLSWATGLVTPPDTDMEFWKSLFPVALAHTIGHVAATVSMSKVAVSFTHIIKSSEPAFSVLIQRLLMGESFSLPVYLSLVPIIGGCGLAALTELNFNMTGFMGAMISNIAFVFRNIFSKKGMKAGKAVGGLNYYACLSIMSLVLLTPFALVVEPPQQWLSAWSPAVQSVGPQLFWWVVAQSVFYHLYNQVSYMSLDEISPLTFSIGNTMKRVTVIVSSIIIFRTPVRAINAVGAAVAILGTFFYSQAKQ